MRYHEIASGFRVGISKEEQDIFTKVGKDGIRLSALECERDQEVARLMFQRGLLNKVRDKDGEIAYRSNSINDIWISRDF